MAPPKPKSAKEARLEKMFKKMGKDEDTKKTLEKESKRKNGPVKKDPPPKPKEKPKMKKRYGGSVKKMARGGIVKGPYS